MLAGTKSDKSARSDLKMFPLPGELIERPICGHLAGVGRAEKKDDHRSVTERAKNGTQSDHYATNFNSSDSISIRNSRVTFTGGVSSAIFRHISHPSATVNEGCMNQASRQTAYSTQGGYAAWAQSGAVPTMAPGHGPSTLVRDFCHKHKILCYPPEESLLLLQKKRKPRARVRDAWRPEITTKPHKHSHTKRAMSAMSVSERDMSPVLGSSSLSCGTNPTSSPVRGPSYHGGSATPLSGLISVPGTARVTLRSCARKVNTKVRDEGRGVGFLGGWEDLQTFPNRLTEPLEPGKWP